MLKPLLPIGTPVRVIVEVKPVAWQGCAYPLTPRVCGVIERSHVISPRRLHDGACDPVSCTEYQYWIKFERHEIDAHAGYLDTSMWCLLCGHEIEPVD